MDAAKALPADLGQRIVQAARLAAAMHLADVFLSGEGSQPHRQRRHIPVGGADLDGFTEEAALSPAADDRPRGRTSPSADGGAE
jgi:hypothetical protein